MAADDSQALLDVGIAALRQQGERVTTARLTVLSILASTSGHLSADQINDEVAIRSPGVHRSTVYRTLESLAQVGVIAHIHLPHGAAAYHLQSRGDRPHVHVVCRSCDAVIDSPAELLDGVASELMRTQGFRLDPDHVALTGWCGVCRDSSLSDLDTERDATQDTERGATQDTERGATQDTERGATQDTERGATQDTERGATQDTEREATQDQ